MNTITVIYIFLAIIVTLLFVYFQYFFKEKNYSNRYLLALLRFISIFSILLLLINPEISNTNFETVKTKLFIAVDNTASIAYAKQVDVVKGIVNQLKKNKELNKKFEITYFSFGASVQNDNNYTFQENQTNINEALNKLNSIVNENTSPIVLISDGNQTFGNSYKFYNSTQPIYPVIIGDTIKFSDLVLDQINVNSYTYSNNRFPVEVFIHYNGIEKINTNFTVEENNIVIYKEKINFSEDKKSAHLNFKLLGNKIGKHLYKASIKVFENEKNTLNNIKNFSVEVIDEQVKVGLVYDNLHPDIGMLKRSIETNKQRKVELVNLNSNINYLFDNDIFILYQPTNKFNAIFNKIKENNTNYFIISGKKTDWNFLNKAQNDFVKIRSNSVEKFSPVFNKDYHTFYTEDIGFSDYSPIVDLFGKIKFNIPYQTLLYQSINGIITNEPLLVTYSDNNKKRVVLFGENIWKWRAISYSNEQSFEVFDQFLNSLLQFLTISNKENTIELNYKSFYYADEPIKITAKSYDSNLNFNSKDKLEIKIEDQNKSIPFFLNGNKYEANLTNLKNGDYKFTVKNMENNNQTEGAFIVAKYSVENEALSANKDDLIGLAINSNGKSYYPNQINNLVLDLVQNKEFVSVQKENKKMISLIDWKWLLAIIVLSLSLEWFIRKYRGLV